MDTNNDASSTDLERRRNINARICETSDTEQAGDVLKQPFESLTNIPPSNGVNSIVSVST